MTQATPYFVHASRIAFSIPFVMMLLGLVLRGVMGEGGNSMMVSALVALNVTLPFLGLFLAVYASFWALAMNRRGALYRSIVALALNGLFALFVIQSAPMWIGTFSGEG